MNVSHSFQVSSDFGEHFVPVMIPSAYTQGALRSLYLGGKSVAFAVHVGTGLRSRRLATFVDQLEPQIRLSRSNAREWDAYLTAAGEERYDLLLADESGSIFARVLRDFAPSSLIKVRGMQSTIIASTFERNSNGKPTSFRTRISFNGGAYWQRLMVNSSETVK